MAPHFHIKVRSALKTDAETAINEIREIIATHLPAIAEVIGR